MCNWRYIIITTYFENGIEKTKDVFYRSNYKEALYKIKRIQKLSTKELRIYLYSCESMFIFHGHLESGD